MSIDTHLQDDQGERFFKSIVLISVIALGFLVLCARLFYLQVVQAELNMRLSMENGMQLHVLKAPRGRIYDRNGVMLARNRPSYSICVLPFKLKKRADVFGNLLKIRDSNNVPLFDSTDLSRRLRTAMGRRFDVTRIKEDVSIEIVSIIEEHSLDLPGIVIETESRREYPLGKTTFHALGYMSEIPENDFESFKARGYLYGDRIGKAGIEKQYEDLFRGVDGREYVEVNAYGKRMGTIKDMPRQEPQAGADVRVSLDSRLQMVADSIFPDSLKGAVVALDPRSGEVLVMLSHPTVDPNIFSMSGSARAKNWAVAALDPNLPLNNRAIAGTFIPGSTFKLVSSLAGLASGKVTASTMFPATCHGSFRIGSRIARCWKPSGHGRLSMIDGVKVSCDVYFYQLGLLVGDKRIVACAQQMGLGGVTGVDLAGEKAGWLSGEEAYNKRFASRGWRWTAGLNCDMAIGQTQIITPIQLAYMVGGFANGKALMKPHVLLDAKNPATGDLQLRVEPVVAHQLDFKPSDIKTIQESMVAVMGPGGTGGQANVPGVVVGGKTGSAENSHGSLTHALFVAAAPMDNPTIAIAVVVENAGHGGSVAAPIAGAVLRYYFANIIGINPDSVKAAGKIKPHG